MSKTAVEKKQRDKARTVGWEMKRISQGQQALWYLGGRCTIRSLIPILVLVYAASGGFAQPSQLRVWTNLNSDWRFERQVHGSGALGSFDRATSDASRVEPRFIGAFKRAYDDSDWQTIALPHTWNKYDVSDEEPGYWRGIGWYRKHFRIDRRYAGKKVAVEFEGANQSATVWLNGRLLGTHKGGYTNFSFEITPLFGQDNVLTVKVDNLFDGSVPPTVKTDYSFYGGIYRSVSLLVTDRTFVSDVYWVTPKVTSQSAEVELHTTVSNRAGRTRNLTLTQQIFDPEGKLVNTKSSKLSLRPGETRSFVQHSPEIASPRLWSPEKPNLYRISSELSDRTDRLDRVDIPLGLRWFNFDPQLGLILNGRRIQIQGTNWHQSYPGMGDALPKSRHVKDMEAMHDMGVNFWRTSHYPHDSATMDASDRLGLMVWEELPINKEIGDAKAYTQNVSQMALEMIDRDRNHPSVLIWGIAGEVNAPLDVARSVVKTVTGIYRTMDPTRPVAMHAPRGEELEELVDIVGAAPSAETDERHRLHPDRVYFDAEYSVALIGRGLYGGGAESEEIALENHEQYLRKLHQRPWMAGGCIWNQFDYDGESYDPVIPHIVSFGMEDVWRIPKEVYFFYQSQWTQRPMVHIVGHWTLAGQDGKPREVKVLTNADKVELFLNGRSLGVKASVTTLELSHPPLLWNVPYQSGVLQAVATTIGGSVIRDEQRTAGPAYKIVLSTDTDKLLSGDADSLAYITASVTDESGAIVPGAHPAITFTSYGPGELLKQSWLGHGTGYTWNTVDGTTRVAFRSTSRSGRAVISAYSPGLRIGQLNVDVTAPGKPDEMNYKELFKKDELN